MECKYCGGKSSSEFCCDDCRHLYDEYIDFATNNKTNFLLGTGVPFALFFLSMFFGHVAILAGLTIALVGVTLSFLPFCAEETVESLGVLRSTRVGRRFGAAFVVTGVALLAVGIGMWPN